MMQNLNAFILWFQSTFVEFIQVFPQKADNSYEKKKAETLLKIQSEQVWNKILSEE
jgi:hypothetical protein